MLAVVTVSVLLVPCFLADRLERRRQNIPWMSQAASVLQDISTLSITLFVVTVV
jgi:hypothetical protein